MSGSHVKWNLRALFIAACLIKWIARSPVPPPPLCCCCLAELGNVQGMFYVMILPGRKWLRIVTFVRTFNLKKQQKQQQQQRFGEPLQILYMLGLLFSETTTRLHFYCSFHVYCLVMRAKTHCCVMLIDLLNQPWETIVQWTMSSCTVQNQWYTLYSSIAIEYL